MHFYFPLPSFTILNKVCITKMVNVPFLFSVLILWYIMPVNMLQACLLVLAFCFSHVNENSIEKDSGPGLKRLGKT